MSRGARPAPRDRGPVRGLVLGLLLLLAGGCAAVEVGPVEPPDPYPDRSTDELALKTWLWAWHTGDVDVLQQVSGAYFKLQIDRLLAQQDRQAVSDWYKRNAQGLAVREIEWLRHGKPDGGASDVRLVLSSEGVPRYEAKIRVYGGYRGWIVAGEPVPAR
ncbi:MAG: hypothetical protein AB7N76_31200 [Planctomycetota bacterium]